MCKKSLVFYYFECTYKGFFKSHRNLRQGDPLSPYMFIIMEDVLSCLLKKILEDTKIGPYLHPRGCPLISHFLYANDILLFINGDRRSLQKKILKTLATYEK